MKRILPLLLLPLALASCGENPDSGAASTYDVSYTVKTVGVHYFDKKEDTTVDLRFYGGTSVPYISLKDYVALLYRGRKYAEDRDRFEVSRKGAVYTCTVAGGYQATFDVGKNVLESDDLFSFKNTNLNGVGPLVNVSYDGLPFTRVKSATPDKAAKKTRIAFSDYHLTIEGDQDGLYVPLGFAIDLFTNENILQGAYNGKDIYVFNYTENEDPYSLGGDYYENMFSNPIDEDYAAYYYNELCLDYDYLLGRPGRSTLEQYYPLQDGLDKALDDRELGKTIKKYLKSTDINQVIAGMQLLGQLRADGGHSVYAPLSTAYYTTNEEGRRIVAYPQWLQKHMAEAYRLFQDEITKYYPELNNACASFGHRNEVYRDRHDKLGKQSSALKGTETYTKDGDIAYIHIDGFMGEIGLQDKWNDYYAGRRDKIPFEDGMGGAVGAIHNGLELATKDDAVKHIVVDLSANSGGSTDEMLFMVYALTGENKFYTHNRVSDVFTVNEYEFDLNFDRVFDEKDAWDASYLNGKDITVLTTQNGFSCGGISPIYLHDDGCFTIGEDCGGGSCSIYMGYDAYGIMNRSSCPSQTFTKRRISVDEARIGVCDSKMEFRKDNGLYDYTSLFDTTTLRGLIEGHYKK